ncbi:HD-GYP domain-containing protein [Pelagibacterium halotolerans]|uniref:Metal dependent phosphohydrolase with a response regulator receiver domain protein n=1 Tax=Pelagibacterium halotolerans (strain DSM 22347 / JCM 15775 / CGMCC 1.7692 / B2) TaxID=1082931 RepID=G4RFH9_PELHB|nr:HD domain-containing phosphohydrolase [Pelagibacterium halotolerans]AEQ52981.1 metal dependent phosphohydrolase with a response regulator receiver domain protein [Pelagibacterium halotolerans B2]QJR17359.1 HD domain-containing protein [Pelagibacterium halotolerans]SEA97609.1 HDIG domain-containing protein [Pelagibacterium halotolerans]
MAGSSVAVLLVTDAPSGASFPVARWPAIARVEPLSELGKIDLSPFSAILVDADLSSSSTIDRLKKSLLALERNIPRYFLVTEGRRVEMVQANVLGAHATETRPLTAEGLQRLLTSTLREPLDELPDTAVTVVAQAASKALGSAFEALRADTTLDSAAMAAASNDIVDSVGAGGLGQWLDTVRAHHHGTYQHCLLVTGVLTNFAQKVGMSGADISKLTTAGLLHDIGKATIPVAILEKPGKLTPEEFAEIARHPVEGFDYLTAHANLGPDILAAVRSHHEYLDGSGYPDGLMGSQIGDLTRIVTICDIYGALSERRAYKPAMSPPEALAILEDMCTAGKLETALVRALREAVEAR